MYLLIIVITTHYNWNISAGKLNLGWKNNINTHCSYFWCKCLLLHMFLELPLGGKPQRCKMSL